MNEHVKFVFSDDFLTYHFHENHPFNQKRVLLTKQLLEAAGLLEDRKSVV